MRKIDIRQENIEMNKQKPAAHLTKYEDVLIRVALVWIEPENLARETRTETEDKVIYYTNRIFEMIQRGGE